MTRRKIPVDKGQEALAAWQTSPEHSSHSIAVTAVRFSLEELAALHPGRSVEVRVPPAGAVQILRGATHRRGTPPAVIECDMYTWLSLVTGKMSWKQALSKGAVTASGERTDLAPFLPLFTE